MIENVSVWNKEGAKNLKQYFNYQVSHQMKLKYENGFVYVEKTKIRGGKVVFDSVSLLLLIYAQKANVTFTCTTLLMSFFRCSAEIV